MSVHIWLIKESRMFAQSSKQNWMSFYAARQTFKSKHPFSGRLRRGWDWGLYMVSSNWSLDFDPVSSRSQWSWLESGDATLPTRVVTVLSSLNYQPRLSSVMLLVWTFSFSSHINCWNWPHLACRTQTFTCLNTNSQIRKQFRIMTYGQCSHGKLDLAFTRWPGRSCFLKRETIGLCNPVCIYEGFLCVCVCCFGNCRSDRSFSNELSEFVEWICWMFHSTNFLSELEKDPSDRRFLEPHKKNSLCLDSLVNKSLKC